MSLAIYRSIFLAADLEKILTANYNLKEPFGISILKIGDNDHYLVKSPKKKYVLRIYKHNKPWLQKKENYLFELEWLIFLQKNKLSVAYPIMRKDGSYIGTIQAPEGTRYWALFNFVNGETAELNKDNCYKYGEAISKIHILSNKFKPHNQRGDINQKILIEDPIYRINQLFGDSKKRTMRSIKQLTQNLIREIKNFAQTNLKDEWGIIGGDFHGSNYFIQDGKVNLFDFDLCGYGWRSYDIAVFKWWLIGQSIYDDNSKKNYNLLWESFLRGYEKYRILTNKESEIIPTFVQARHIWYLGYSANNHETAWTNKYWDELFCNLIEGNLNLQYKKN